MHVSEKAVSFRETLSGSEIHSVIHNAEQDTRKVDIGHARTAIAPLAGDCRLHTANGAVVVRILFPDAPVDK